MEEKIHDKYRKFINQHNSGYLTGLTYDIAMEMLRYCENKLGKSIPLNMSCGTCVYELVSIFKNLEEK